MNVVHAFLKMVFAATFIMLLSACGNSQNAGVQVTTSDNSNVENALITFELEREYADSGMVVELNPQLMQNNQVQSATWRQLSGPSAYIQPSEGLNARVVLPFVEEPQNVALELQVDFGASAATLNKVITVLPLDRRIEAQPFLMTAKSGENNSGLFTYEVGIVLGENQQSLHSLEGAQLSWRNNNQQLQLVGFEVLAEGTLKVTVSAAMAVSDLIAVLNVHFLDGHIDAAVLFIPSAVNLSSAASSSSAVNTSSSIVSSHSSSSLDSSVQSSSANNMGSSSSFSSSLSDEQQSAIEMACNGLPSNSRNATEAKVINPFADAALYNDPDFFARAMSVTTNNPLLKEAIAQVATQSTGIWVDHHAKLCGPTRDGRMSLLAHLQKAQDEALLKSMPVVVPVVLFDLPGRDCGSGAAPGLNAATNEGLDNYKSTINNMAALAGIFPDVRVVVDIEPGALAAAVQASTSRNGACTQEAIFYSQGVSYALATFAAVPNIYSYVDVAHAGWLGWNIDAAVDQLMQWLAAAESLSQSEAPLLTGVATNVAEYIPLVEPYMQALNIASSRFYNFNSFVSAIGYARVFTDRLKAQGIPAGALIDTARNGWGGVKRPQISGIGESYRLDQRRFRADWCNHPLAGMGEFPLANPSTNDDFIHAYTWLKPPGESDGDDSVMACDSYVFDALPNSPKASEWFEAHFLQLVDNAWPPLAHMSSPQEDEVVDIALHYRVDGKTQSLADAQVMFPLANLQQPLSEFKLWLGGVEQVVTPIVEEDVMVISLSNLVPKPSQQALMVQFLDASGIRHRGLLNYGAGDISGGSSLPDFILVNRSSSFFEGGEGDDVLIDQFGGRPLAGGQGRDWLFGDRLYGGEGDDTLVIRESVNTLDVNGGEGSDTYIFDILIRTFILTDELGQNRIFIPNASQEVIQWKAVTGSDGNAALELTMFESAEKKRRVSRLVLNNFYRQESSPFVTVSFADGLPLAPDFFTEARSQEQ